MRNRLIFVSLLLTCLPCILLASSRAHSWKPKAQPGSARLPLVNIQKIVLPSAASKRLIAATTDLQAVWLERVGERLEIVKWQVVSSKVEPQNAIVLQHAAVQSFAEWRGYQIAGSFTLSRKDSSIY
ncbi:MAG: hypothetical protein VX033_01140, partial [Verrucomicrobiota bacterium]|nr:hypothetical protein [Verrucomicrobiota bacterium]